MAFNWRKFPWTNLQDLNLDWIIQTVKTLENNLADAVSTFKEMIDAAISNTLTGSGDLTISKTGDVNITGNNVRITSGGNAQITGGAVISDGTQQLVLHSPNSNTSMIAHYSSGVLRLHNNQDAAAGVALSAINTPADSAMDNSDFAANVGYVKDAVNTVDSKLDTEISNRTSGDAALQSTIDDVIMPLLNARGVRDFHVTGTVGQDRELTSVSFNSENPKSELDNLLTGSTKVRLVVELPDETRYFSMCYNTTTDYGFSGMYKAPSNTAIHELIIYNGTTFEVLWQ